MLLPLRKQLKYVTLICTTLLLMTVQTVHAAGPPAPSAFDNPVTTGFVILALILLLIIAILANLLMGVAQVKLQKDKTADAAARAAVVVTTLLVLFCSPAMAQGNTANAATAATGSIGGISVLAFYIMASVIFLELLVVLVLLVNVRILLRADLVRPEKAAAAPAIKAKISNWWMRLNSFKPVEQNADLDLGHDYDGIRELDNRLPPWWLYGFYLTIFVAGIYLYRYHIAHTGPSSGEEYTASIANADKEVQEYLKKQGDAVDENTVKLLTVPDEIAAGKEIFLKSCIACHKEDARGDVGPNLTDEYWLHGGDVKSVFKTIRYGINAMPQWQNSYSNKQIAELASYVKSLKGSNPPNAKAPQGVLYKEDVAAPGAVADSAAVKKDSSVVSAH